MHLIHKLLNNDSIHHWTVYL